MLITALSVYKGDTWEIELNSDSKYYINGFVIARFGLKKGDELSDERLEEIIAADTLRKAKKRALYLLGERAYCSGELKKKLTKNYGEEIAERAVDYASELGYINDEDYAGKYAEYLIKAKRHGISRARREMLMKGLSKEITESALAEFTEEELDEELIFLIKRKYSEKISDYDARRKTIAALARRGYGFGSIKRCIEAVINEKLDEEFEVE
ncbi:MAG: RecX family transcriptional regulator [Oscillospiraceae bacterium]|nr:RecX family transcriptional regulator [Oscillospiraceae bacterium]